MVHWSKGCSRDLKVMTVVNLVWDPVFLILWERDHSSLVTGMFKRP